MASLAPTSGGGGSSAGAGAARTVATESAAAPSGVTKNMTSSKFAAGLPREYWSCARANTVTT